MLPIMTQRRVRADPASSASYGLAEGPVWDAGRERLLWVNVNAGAVHPGRLADLILVRGNPLDSMIYLQNVERVIKGGVVFEPAALRGAAE